MKYRIRRLIYLLMIFMSINNLYSQRCFTNSDCKFYTNNCENRTIEWSGKCTDGYLQGYGELKVFEEGKQIYLYVGNIDSGKFNGQGVIKYSAGASYNGSFKDGKYHGSGVYNYSNGASYNGSFKDGKFHGYGVYNYPDGRIHKGMNNEDEMEGECIFYWPDGSRWEGIVNVSNPKPGLYYSNKGEIIKGWDFYSIISAKDKNEEIKHQFNIELRVGYYFTDSSCSGCEPCSVGYGEKKMESKEVKAFCDGELVGKWSIIHTVKCPGSNAYQESFNVRGPGINSFGNAINETSAIEYIRKLANDVCDGQKNTFSIENIIERAASKIPATNLVVEDFIKSHWDDPKRDGSFTFYPKTIRYDSPNGKKNRKGTWEYYPNFGVILISWKANDFNFSETIEVISLIRDEQGRYKAYSFLEDEVFINPVIKIYHYDKDLNKVYEPSYKNLINKVERRDFELLEFCDVCYWRDQAYKIGEKTSYYSRFYSKEIEFTCNINGDKVFWSSELLDNPYFVDPELDYCLSCQVWRYTRNSPGFFIENTDNDPWHCIVYKKKNGKITCNDIPESAFQKYRDRSKN